MTFEVQNASFAYDKNRQLLRDIHFDIGDREILAILGSNGAGKTTLLKCMLGLLAWTQGQTLIDGMPLGAIRHRDVWTRIGYVPQAKLSTFAYTALDMVLLGRSAHLKMLEHPGPRDVAVAEECLKEIGILHLRDKLCSRISGGELQMVLIARALAAKPSLLVLDEPESNLDFRNQLVVMNAIRELRDRYGISSVVNTHYPEHAIDLADKALILQGDGGALFGPAGEVMTEQSLTRTFGVHVRIRDIVENDRRYTCVLPVSIA